MKNPAMPLWANITVNTYEINIIFFFLGHINHANTKMHLVDKQKVWLLAVVYTHGLMPKSIKGATLCEKFLLGISYMEERGPTQDLYLHPVFSALLPDIATIDRLKC